MLYTILKLIKFPLKSCIKNVLKILWDASRSYNDKDLKIKSHKTTSKAFSIFRQEKMYTSK